MRAGPSFLFKAANPGRGPAARLRAAPSSCNDIVQASLEGMKSHNISILENFQDSIPKTYLETHISLYE